VAGLAAVFTVRYLPQWLHARCVLRAVSLGRKSLAPCLAESSAAADDGDSVPVILIPQSLEKNL